MAGDATLLVEFEERIDLRVNERVIALARAVREARLPGVRDVVPAYRTVGVSFDPLGTDLGRLLKEIEALAAAAGATRPPPDPALVRVPVCYGGEHGPDLDRARRGRRPDRRGGDRASLRSALSRVHDRVRARFRVSGVG